jgi:hypothetical protein
MNGGGFSAVIARIDVSMDNVLENLRCRVKLPSIMLDSHLQARLMLQVNVCVVETKVFLSFTILFYFLSSSSSFSIQDYSKKSFASQSI